ncbi:hypothetical protein D9Q98_005317 [Chlorella vulgaris]|uniref:Uncharacterized protein n=1 Tax=Chlorella vulgaris TaxID=3077 RepID=A0A9D4TP86_CHLVU|nr:hypothetical protein D9Q98_005317 [Chlorella vulgaris]
MKAVSSVSLRCTPCAFKPADLPKPSAQSRRRAVQVVARTSSRAQATGFQTPPASFKAPLAGCAPRTGVVPLRIRERMSVRVIEPATGQPSVHTSPASGRKEPANWCDAPPPSYAQHLAAAPVYKAADSTVAPWLHGLVGVELEQALQAVCPGFRGAIAAATANLSPATAAATMLNLTAQYSGLLSAVAPGGSSLVVLLPTGIDSLLERCISCSRLLVAEGQHQAAFEAATAATTLLSFLRFGTAAVAETFCAAWVELRLILNSTASSPATDITSEGALCLWEACARAAFFATPWFGYRFQAAIEAHIAAGWDTAELAVRCMEAWATLATSARLTHTRSTPTAARFQALMEAVMTHDLSLQQVQQAEAVLCLLPDEQLPAWEPRLEAHRSCLQEQQQQVASVSGDALAAVSLWHRVLRCWACTVEAGGHAGANLLPPNFAAGRGLAA